MSTQIVRWCDQPAPPRGPWHQRPSIIASPPQLTSGVSGWPARLPTRGRSPARAYRRRQRRPASPRTSCWPSRREAKPGTHPGSATGAVARAAPTTTTKASCTASTTSSAAWRAEKVSASRKSVFLVGGWPGEAGGVAGCPPQRRGPRLVGAVVRLVVPVVGGILRPWSCGGGAAVAGGPRSKVLGLISGGVGMGPARWWPWVGAGWLRCGAGGVGIFLCLCGVCDARAPRTVPPGQQPRLHAVALKPPHFQLAP